MNLGKNIFFGQKWNFETLCNKVVQNAIIFFFLPDKSPSETVASRQIETFFA